MASPKRSKGKERKIRTPLSQVEERFGSKENLIKEIEKLRGKGDLLVEKFSDKGIERVSNAKLMRIHGMLSEVAGQFPSRTALVDAFLEMKHRSKDQPYRDKLMTYTLGRLVDMYRAARRKGPAKG